MLDKGKMRKGGLLTYLLLVHSALFLLGGRVAQFSPGLPYFLTGKTENWTDVEALSILQSPSSFRAGRVVHRSLIG